MNTKTNAEMLVALKRYNKTARETKAKKEGFKDAVSFIAYLEGFINSGLGGDAYFSPKSKPTEIPENVGQGPAVKQKESKQRPVIHVADVLDSSGSMSGSKHAAAIKGINLGVENLKKDVAEVDYTYTLCDFSSDVVMKHITEKLSKVSHFRSITRGATALYDAIGETITRIQDVAKPEDKVLVNIYTDGEENCSTKFNTAKISALIKELSKIGWTFTFIGTAGDVAFAQRNLKFDASNTLVHDNTGAGMEKAFTANNTARSTYSSKVSAGEDVSRGFYKDIN